MGQDMVTLSGFLGPLVPAPHRLHSDRSYLRAMQE